MADAEEPQFNTLAERIAALNKQSGFQRPPPPPPPSKAAVPPPLPRRDTHASPSQRNGLSVPPPLPSRASSSGPLPPQPPRRTSTQSSLVTARRTSESSDHSSVSSLFLGRPPSSTTSQGSSGGAAGSRKLPPAICDPASLPPLPPTRREREARAQETTQEQATIAKGLPAKQAVSPAKPSLPPRLPSRTATSPKVPAKSETDAGKDTSRKLPAMVIRGFSSGQSTVQRPHVPVPVSTRQSAATVHDDAPPPVPLASRPSAAQIDSVSARSVPSTTRPPNSCLVCRDWSVPDSVAAQFPRETLPRNDPVGHLARGLCGSFPSYTDKARAIFTWFHHNIYYDTVAFFGNNIQRMSVEDTIFSGRAVCQGYAETYKAIANKAGLDCIVVGGHGKGFGHVPLKPGERPPPPKPDGHAWNAVRIDGGDWKLIDACWGAGHICGTNNMYKKEFSPHQFTTSNELFGLRHFPSDPSHQFRSDGRVVSWEEYFRGPVDGEPPVFFTDAHQEGIAEDSVEPKGREISVHSGRAVRFQFSKICEHWTSEKNGLGKPPLLLLSVHGVGGRRDEMVPMETNGFWHWLDVNDRDLGAPGQSVQVAQLTTIDGKDARGVSAREYLSSKGRVAMSWSYAIKWDLV